MRTERKFPCSAVQFFNFMAKRLADDIQIETDKKLTIAQIHQGMKYEKRIQVTEKKERTGKAQITVYEKPSRILLTVEMWDGVQTIETVIQAIDDHSCNVVYEEIFKADKPEKALAIKGFSLFNNKKNKKKLDELMDLFEEQIRKTYPQK